MHTKHFNIQASELQYNHRNVILDAGYPDITSAGYFVDAIDQINKDILSKLDIQAAFRIVENVKIGSATFVAEHHTYNAGKVITHDLAGSEHMAFFVCTIGEGFETFLKPIFDESPAEGYLADLLGSMIVEAAADWIEKKIIETAQSEFNYHCTNRFSPGYCGWSVAEQHKLFSLFPDKVCGITLSESSLMHPRKSVSGVIGMGTDVRKRKYQCGMCDVEHCFRRKRKMTQN